MTDNKTLNRINEIYLKIEELEYTIEYGDTTPLCDINGICEVITWKDTDDFGFCHYCGSEIIKDINGGWYHHSAFDENNKLIDEDYQTHENYGVTLNDPTSVEQRELFELEEELKILLKILK